MIAIQTSPQCARDPSRPPGKRERTVVFALFLIFLAAGFCTPGSLFAAEIRGNVVGVRGEPLARVQVSILEAERQAITGDDGGFVIADLAPGDYTLQANAVGYRLINVRFSFAAGEETKDFEITLTPDNFTRTDTVQVTGDKFQGSDSPAIQKTDLTAEEIRQTSTVLADDPFRSIQTLPGVSASGGNDFFAQSSVMGAPYQDVAIYIDGILIPSPFHGMDITQGATLSILTSENLENIELLPAAYPEKYGDDVGAALELDTRDGSRAAPVYRISAGLADSEVDAEGPLGRLKRGSWLGSARKSYLGYLFRNRLNDQSDDVSFYDADLKLNYDVAPKQTVDFYGVGGPTLYQVLNTSTAYGPNDIAKVVENFMMGRIGWRWAVDPRLLVEAHGAYFQQPSTESNIDAQPLDDAHYTEWVAAGSVVSSWRKDETLEGGWMARRASTEYEQTNYNPPNPAEKYGATGDGWKNDGYVQQSSALLGGRVNLAGGLRIDTAALFSVHPLSPQISAAWQVAPATQLQLAVGRYHQFYFPATIPAITSGISSTCSESMESLQAANHYIAAIEQRLGESARVKLLLFDRNNDESYAQSISGGCPPGFVSRGFLTTERDYSRGAQIVLQSRNANRLSGWIGYTLTYARQGFYNSNAGLNSLPLWSPYYPTIADQRHTLNLFANYRLTPTLNLGGKFLFGSGYPVPTSEFDSVRLGDYQRLDVRAEKDWAFRRWKLALYGELLNATDHYNPRYFYTDNSGSVVTGQGLPITPTAGVAFEF
ncbi:MAG: carboxypeptidase regulatory-like domain-containing protein [Terracidiphilus sp.]